MPFIVCDEGELNTMDLLASHLNGTPYIFRLFTNNVAVELDSVVGDFDVATFPGYADQSATGWTAAILDVDGFGRIEHPVRIWEKGDGAPIDETVYGWLLLKSDESEIYGGELLPVPVLMDVTGKTITIHPVLTGQSKNVP